jgi:hypothetical protein
MTRFEDVEPTYTELLRQGGLVAALVDAARIFADAGREMSNALHGCAVALDEERRGHASIGHRSDGVAAANTIEALLRGDLLHESERETLRERILAVLQQDDGQGGAKRPGIVVAVAGKRDKDGAL